MKNDLQQTCRLHDDLGLDAPFSRGRDNPVNNCWHFCTDGKAVDVMFYDENDFIAGMNRIYTVIQKFRILILAFVLMDTHIHFVLHGDYDACNGFMHEYLRRTSQYISTEHNLSKPLHDIPVTHQVIDTDSYLKTVICYVCKNAPVGGLPYMPYDYPWSSAPLYFRNTGSWATPAWASGKGLTVSEMSHREKREFLKSKEVSSMGDVKMCGKLIFPGEYVAVEPVERLYRSARSFQYFMGRSKSDDVESRGGAISYLTIPIQEMRQHKNEMCKELFGVCTVKNLGTAQRMKLARALKSKYNCSLKQISRLCGLVFEEIDGLF